MSYSLESNGYNAGYIKDNFGCIKRPCECAGFALKDKTIIGMDFKPTSLLLKTMNLGFLNLLEMGFIHN